MTKRTTDTFFKRFTAESYYKLIDAMGAKTVYNHADFRFMSSRALNALAQYPERNLYLRGMIPTIGFRTATVDDVISERIAGQSKYTLTKMLRLASDGITSFSSKPMVIVLAAGSLIIFSIIPFDKQLFTALALAWSLPAPFIIPLYALVTYGFAKCGLVGFLYATTRFST